MTAREAENPPLEIEAQAARRGEDTVESREVRVRRRDEGREQLLGHHLRDLAHAPPHFGSVWLVPLIPPTSANLTQFITAR